MAQLSGTAMLATLPHCWPCDALPPEEWLNCGEDAAYDRGCEVAKALRRRGDELAKLNREHPFFPARKIILGHDLAGKNNIAVAIPKDTRVYYLEEEPVVEKKGGYTPAANLQFPFYESCQVDGPHPTTADAKRAAFAACFLHEQGLVYAVSCKPCDRAKRGPCGTNHLKAAGCKVLEQMNAPENADTIGIFRAAGDTVGAFLYSLLKAPADEVNLPAAEMVWNYMVTYADAERSQKIFELLAGTQLLDQVHQVSVAGAAAHPGAADDPVADPAEDEDEAEAEAEEEAEAEAEEEAEAGAVVEAEAYAPAAVAAAEATEAGANPAAALPPRLPSAPGAAPPYPPPAGNAPIPPGYAGPVLSPRDPRRWTPYGAVAAVNHPSQAEVAAAEATEAGANPAADLAPPLPSAPGAAPPYPPPAGNAPIPPGYAGSFLSPRDPRRRTPCGAVAAVDHPPQAGVEGDAAEDAQAPTNDVNTGN